jgi:hypothetical protein
VREIVFIDEETLTPEELQAERANNEEQERLVDEFLEAWERGDYDVKTEE